MVTNRRSLGVITFLAASALTACSDAPTHDLTAPLGPRLGSVSGQRASTFTTNEVFPFAFVSVECGMTVELSGRLHVVVHGTISSSGNVHAVVHVNPQNIRGFEPATGNVYLAPGMAQTVTNLNGPAPVTETFVNNFHLIGHGAALDFLFHQNMHITINANGEITAAFDHVNFACK